VSILAKLNLTQLKRPTSKSPQDKRRDNLIQKLEEQSKLAEHEAKGTKYSVTKTAFTRDEAGNKTKITRDKLIRPWYFADGTGMSLTIRYGARVLSLDAKGKKAIAVASVKEIPAVVAAVIDACRAGELDLAMESAIQAGKTKAPARS
jgi:hypothetical protein